jgi:TonB-linked SusC/RagA family outer membrane protein
MRKLFLTLSALFFLLINTQAQNRTITGKVTDENGQGIQGVSVLVKGTRIGTETNADGNFSLSVPVNAKTLVISSVNMTTQEIAITGGTVNVALAVRANNLEEVVINVPYGTIKKSAFTGSENTVTAAQIEKQRVTSVTHALEGMVPGLSSTNGGGAPGTDASILIRGVGSVSIYTSSSPLYVLNGAPYDGSISSISTSDIESITVLKDAAASALYGSRAANGVIMITTKRGKQGRAAVTANVYQGFQSRGIPEYDRVDSKQYYELMWEAYRNSYKIGQGQSSATAGINASNVLTGPSGLVYNAYNVPGNQLVDPTTGKLNPNAQLLWNESWADALFRTAPRTEANVSVSGASDKADYYLSAGYLNEDGILRFSGYKRYNLRLNVNVAATNWLNAGINIDGGVSKIDSVLSGGGTATTNPFYYSREMGPIYPVYQHNLLTGAFVDSAGQHQLDWGTPAQMGTRPYAGRSNLLGSLNLDDRSRYLFNGNANPYAEIKFTKELALKATLSVNYLTNNITEYQNNQYGDAAPTAGPGTGGRSTKTFDRQLSITGNEVLTFIKNLDKHNIRALAGHENYKYQYNYLSANSQGFFFPGQSELDNGTSVFSNPSSYQIDQTIESYFGGLYYDYNQKYHLSATYRTDGSSKFRDAVRWGNFYSVGASWKVKKENFMENIDWLTDLNLRGSYGEQGNQSIPNDLYRSYYYASGIGTYNPPIRPASPDISWEKNAILDFGVDFGFLNNRVTGTFDWYDKRSSNLLFDVPLPTSTGYASVFQNVGTMKNTGVELQLNYSPIRSRNFNWNITANLFHEKNEITKLPAVQDSLGIISGTKKLLPGHSIYDFFLPEYAGVDAANGDALYYRDVLDASGKATGRVTTNVYNSATKYYVGGSALPKFRGGLQNSFDYKGFNLSIFLTFAYGGKFYDGNYASIMHRGSPGIAWSTDILQRWQKPGDVTTVPRLQNAISGQDGQSSRWLVDASYLNIKNVTLSYSLTQKTAEHLHLGKLTMHANIDNAWLFTAKNGSDIQRDFNGTADATYTPVRTVTVGLSVNLQ